MSSRRPNCSCCVCGALLYRRPNELDKWKVYCTKACMDKARGIVPRECRACGKMFKPTKRTGRFCSKSCANTSRRGLTYSKGSQGNSSQRRLALLRAAFRFETCMVEGCEYDLTFDIHRLITGGPYELGNMFAICPNHHAEVHRGITVLEKVSNCILRRA